MRLTGIYHTGITVSDLERSLRFYRDRLGMKLVAEQLGTASYLSTITGFSGVKLKAAFLKAEGESEHVLELLEYVSHPGEPQDLATNRPGNCHLCFKVDDIWDSYERLKADGIKVKSQPVAITVGIHKDGYSFYLHDPDGVTLEFFQPPPSAHD